MLVGDHPVRARCRKRPRRPAWAWHRQYVWPAPAPRSRRTRPSARRHAGAGEHGDQRLRDHRHVDDDTVPALYAAVTKGSREPRHLFQELRVRQPARRAGDRAVIDDRKRIAAACQNVAIDGVVTRVEGTAHEPARRRAGGPVQDLVPPLGPLNGRRGLAPECLWPKDRFLVSLLVRSAHAAPLGPEPRRDRQT